MFFVLRNQSENKPNIYKPWSNNFKCVYNNLCAFLGQIHIEWYNHSPCADTAEYSGHLGHRLLNTCLGSSVCSNPLSNLGLWTEIFVEGVVTFYNFMDRLINHQI